MAYDSGSVRERDGATRSPNRFPAERRSSAMVDHLEAVELDSNDTAELLALYREFDWWADREAAGVERALANGLAVGLRDDGDLIAAARALTDRVYYAKVYDVIVAASRRRDGVGEVLVGAVLDHDALAGVNVIELTCREGLIPFYERCGFAVHDATVETDGSEETFVKMNYEG